MPFNSKPRDCSPPPEGGDPQAGRIARVIARPVRQARPGSPAAAAQLLARMTEDELRDAILELGDEEDAAEIARLIVQRRARHPILTTDDLTAIVCEARDFTLQRAAGAKLHPAARTFQALRILVNREMQNLERLLDDAPSLLRPGGRIALANWTPDGNVYGMFKVMRAYMPPPTFPGPPSPFAWGRRDRVDELLRKGRTTIDDKARVPLYREAQKLVVEDAPWIFVDHGKQVIVYRKRVQGFKLHPNFDLVLTQVWLQ